MLLLSTSTETKLQFVQITITKKKKKISKILHVSSESTLKKVRQWFLSHQLFWFCRRLVNWNFATNSGSGNTNQIQIYKKKERKSTVAVTSVTDNPLFLLNRWSNVSVTLTFFWVLLKSPESSISPTEVGAVQLDNLLFENKEMVCIDLVCLANCVKEREDWAAEQEEDEDEATVASAEERDGRAEAKAASMKAISSSLTISIGISGRLPYDSLSLRGEACIGGEDDSAIFLSRFSRWSSVEETVWEVEVAPTRGYPFVIA